MTFNRRRFLQGLLAVPLLAVAACETPVEKGGTPEITFQHLAPLKLDVAQIEVDNRYRAPLKAPNVEHLFPTSPAKALTQWATDRLKPVGRQGVARLIIDQASAVEVPLKRDSSWKGAFTKQQSHRYDVTLKVSLEVEGTGNGRRAVAHANANRSQSLREDTTLNQRERIWFDVVGKVMDDFNGEMERNARRYLVDWLR